MGDFPEETDTLPLRDTLDPADYDSDSAASPKRRRKSSKRDNIEISDESDGESSLASSRRNTPQPFSHRGDSVSRDSLAGTPNVIGMHKATSMKQIVNAYADDDLVSSEDDELAESADKAEIPTQPGDMNENHHPVPMEQSSDEESTAEEGTAKYDVSTVVELRPNNSDRDSDVQLPPSPKSHCSGKLKDKIERYRSLVKNGGYDMNEHIRKRKDFRNPSIYEKLVEHCGIDEKGSNYPVELFDPHCWGHESMYDHLAKVQRDEMEKREKERKERAKIEFKKASQTSENTDKRRSKWDSQPSADSVQTVPDRKGPIIPPANIIPVTRTIPGLSIPVINTSLTANLKPDSK